MSNPKNINLNIINRYLQHKEIYGPEHPFHYVSNGSGGEREANFTFCYDYERLPQDQWLFHADSSVSIIPYGKVMTRTTMEVTATPVELFSPPIISLAIQEALKTAASSFNLFSTENNFPFTKPIPTGHLVAGFVQGSIDGYTNYRAKEDALNGWVATMLGFTLTPGVRTNLIIKGTCMIIDHILYENPAFNGEHNRNSFLPHVPLERYETVKWKCLQIDKQNVEFTWLHTIYFFHCLDCALQILLGEHADTITPGIEKFGMTELRRQEYITFSSEMLRVVKKQLNDKELKMPDREKQIDWNSLIR